MTMAIDHDHRDCLVLFAKLSEYIDNELDEPTCHDIEDHAGACIPCKVYLETLRQSVGLCGYLAREEKPVSESFSNRLKAMIERLR